MNAFRADKPLRIGLLGASRIAPKVAIEPAAARDDVTVTAVAARDPARAGAFAETHGIAGVAANYAALIARDDVDMVYNGLPIAAHAEWTTRALEAGKPVLCEKALALNADEARAMVATAERTGLQLIEAFHYRYHGVIRRAEAVMRSGELGRLTGVQAAFNVTIAHNPDEIRWRADQGGGALGDLGCYPAHALRTLVGAEPEVVAASADVRHGVDAATSATLRFPGGIAGTLSCSMVEDRFVAEVVIDGEHGRLRIINFVAPQMGCRFTVEIGESVRTEPTEGPSTYAAQMDHVVDVMNGRFPALTGGADAIANMVLMDAIRAAA
jgi:predicted dehydrogenase